MTLSAETYCAFGPGDEMWRHQLRVLSTLVLLVAWRGLITTTHVWARKGLSPTNLQSVLFPALAAFSSSFKAGANH